MLDNKSILVTGGTGSFGKRFIKTVLERYEPERLIVFSRDELKQFEMRDNYNSSCMRYFLGDIRDYDRINMALERVDVVIHAAALKQVPALEYNPMEAVKTNILGTENVLRAALNNNVEKVICLSTDKAASPINLYGATKLAADKLAVASNNIHGIRKTRFSVVRYGNVIGSRGSVIPFFQNIVAKGGGSIPITDGRMTRFLITLQHGVDFVLSCLEKMKGGEIFVPKIPSATIETIAKAVAPNLEHDIVGMRAGEKLHEVMCPADLSYQTLEFESYFLIKPSSELMKKIDYSYNSLGEEGKYVREGFEYNSLINEHYLNDRELATMINDAMPFDG
ncbi:MAG: UDP-N-acetylglucosamine 4,6-dehydratase (inverting) [Rickettsiales bacterium]